MDYNYIALLSTEVFKILENTITNIDDAISAIPSVKLSIFCIEKILRFRNRDNQTKERPLVHCSFIILFLLALFVVE